MSHRFIYDERSSELFDAGGRRLGVVWCAGSPHWNQLWRTAPSVPDACCAHCGRPILDLAHPAAPRRLERSGEHETLGWCLYTSEGARLVQIQDPKAPPLPAPLDLDPTRPFPVHTVRGLLNINRAAAMGYWPDVRLVKPAVTKLRAQVGVLQSALSGEVRVTHDTGEWERLRGSDSDGAWLPVVSPTPHYPYALSHWLAAYAVPPGLPDGTPLLVRDPVEDVIGTAWSRGDVLRAEDVPGVLQERRVVLRQREVKTAWIIGDAAPGGPALWG